MYFFPRKGILAAMRKTINDNSKQTTAGILSIKKTGKENKKTKSSFDRGSILFNKKPPIFKPRERRSYIEGFPLRGNKPPIFKPRERAAETNLLIFSLFSIT